MSVLLLRLNGVMQSYGTQSKGTVRFAGLEPSKSAVIGMICCALGIGRKGDIRDFSALKFGVRADMEGKVLDDYQIVSEIMNAKGRELRNVIRHKYFLCDAAFLVGLEFRSDQQKLLSDVVSALENPKWQLYLGRKAYVFSRPPIAGDPIRNSDLETVLRAEPWYYPAWDWHRIEYVRWPDLLRYVIDDSCNAIGEVRRDDPRSFNRSQFSELHCSVRTVKTDFVPVEPIKPKDDVPLLPGVVKREVDPWFGDFWYKVSGKEKENVPIIAKA